MTVPLTPSAMLAAASAAAGLDDFGDESFVEGLTVYLDSVTTEAALTETGSMVISAGVVRVLVNRLRYLADLARHPEIAEQRIVAPIVVLGVPRTGTTKLQRMISTDPAVQRLDLWRLLNPAPLPGSEEAQQDPRIAVALEYEAMLGQLAPAFMAAHPTLALEPDEDAYLLDMSFECLFPQLRTRVPGYGAWLTNRRTDRPYEFLRAMLQYLQWQDGGHADRPWILKTPLHLGNLPALLRVFPDAVLVHSHRDLAEVLPSICRMVETARQVVAKDVDPVALGAEMLGLWSGEMARYVDARATLAPDVLDVDYRDIVTDAQGVVDRIYRHAGREPSTQARAGFARWEADNPQHRHGRNDYDLGTYGLTADAITHAFRN